MTKKSQHHDLAQCLFSHIPKGNRYSEPDDAYDWHGTETELVIQTTKFFENPNGFIHDYSEMQLTEGLDYLISSTGEALLWRIAGNDVSWTISQLCLRVMPTLFAEFFAPRCPTILDKSNNALSQVCFMWWDAADCYPHQASVEKPEFDAEVLNTMTTILALPYHSCQESALHGLGHWHSGYPNKVETIVDQYLRINPTIPEELHNYAKQAAQGDVI